MVHSNYLLAGKRNPVEMCNFFLRRAKHIFIERKFIIKQLWKNI
jgi:hypothetical protein